MFSIWDLDGKNKAVSFAEVYFAEVKEIKPLIMVNLENEYRGMQ